MNNIHINRTKKNLIKELGSKLPNCQTL
uniref:Uncharacterized protein n=1 Tax=Rhizophora mucronata TaxID=61149 RepID=A0A2P2NRF7_RHIMU